MEDYCEYLIQEISSAMNTLREEYPEVVMKLYFSPGQAMEDADGTYIDGLDCVFDFEEV